MDNDINVLGGLFQQIIADLKNNSPVWEDFLSKTSKLHSSLKTTLGAIALFLDAFQKIADAATNSRGATKDIGTVLTRICLRHRAVESRLKNFTSALVECLVTPLQEKQDEWKRAVAALDKEHTKEYKKIRSDVKKKALEAARLQKKVRKVRGATVTLGGSGSIVGTTSMGSNQVLSGTVTVGSSELVKSAEAAQADLANKVAELHEAEKQAVKMALVEERSRFCLFVKFLKPILNEEMAMVGEFSHMEESVSLLEKYTADPEALPVASEQMLVDLKGLDASAYSFKTPPGSPRSMGSRKSSMCSISSLQSSASSESATSNQTQQSSPTLNALRTRISVQHNLTVGTRLSSVSSQDSGFTSQDTLVVMRMNARGGLVPESMADHNRGSSDTSSASSNSSTPLSPYPPHNPATATWPNLQETMQFMDMNKGGPPPDRPHTISTAYERGRQRPELSPYTFHPLESIIQSKGECDVIPRVEGGLPSLLRQRSGSQSSQESAQDRNSSGYASLPKASVRPPVPTRNSSGERPALPARNPGQSEGTSLLPDFHTTAPDMVVPHPVYMNAAEIFSMKSESEYGSSMSLDYASLQYASPSDSGLGDASPPQSDISEPYYASTASIRRQKYAMRSRTEGPVVKPPLLPRPGSDIYRSVIRRPSCAKPPPPARSTSISASPLDSIEGSPSAIGNLEDLPPPPPPSDFASEVDYSNLPPPPPEFLLDGDRRPNQRSLSVADAVKSLTIVNHQPASPNSIRRSQSVRIKVAENNDATRRARNSVQVSHGRSQSQGRTEGSPKIQRKATAVEPPKVRDGNWLLNRPDPTDPDSLVVNKSSSLLAKTSFLESLNSKLQQQLNHSEGTSPKPVQRTSESVCEIRPHDSVQEYAQRSHDLALRVRNYINSRVVPDPTTCRETLLDQIRRGTSLKNARPSTHNMGPR